MLLTFGVVFPYRKEAVGEALLWFLGIVLFQLVCNITELVLPGPEGTLLFAKLQHLSQLSMPIAWLIFAATYSGYEAVVLRKRNLVFLVLPLAGVIGAFTNELHHWFWATVDFPQIAGFTTMKPTYGPLFWITGVYSYILMLGGSGIVLWTFFRGPGLYRKQSILVVLGVVVPLIFNLLYVFRVLDFLRKDFTSVSFAAAGIFFYMGIYWHRLFNIMPVARGRVLQALNEGVLVFDRDWRLVDFNAAAENLVGISAGSLGRSISELGLNELLQNSAADPSDQQVGEAFLRVRGTTITPSSGGDLGFIITVEDVTQQHSLQNQLEQVRVSMFHQDKLASIGQLAAGIAHEINNPLGSLASGLRSLEILINRSRAHLDSTAAGDIQEILHESKESLDRIQGTISSMLNFARKTSAPVEFFSPMACIHQTLQLLGTELNQGVRVDLQLGSIPDIQGAASRLNQIILNLILNALYALREGRVQEPQIFIRSYADDLFGYIEFENNGPPVPEELSDQIFEPFVTTKPEGEGTGLGLSVARELAGSFPGGELRLSSCQPVVFRLRFSLGGGNNQS